MIRFVAICLIALAGCSGNNGNSSPNTDAGSVGDADRDGDTTVPVDIVEFSDRVWTWDQTSDSCAFANNGLPWDWLLHGREPADGGQYPVFLYFHGTGDIGDGPAQISIVESMAARGFVAASVTYDSLSGTGQVIDDPLAGCGIVEKKLECLVGSGTDSAVTKTCGRPKADCSRGIVVAGHSQGAALSILSKDHEERIRAAWGLSGGIRTELAVGGIDAKPDLSPCILPGTRALPADRLRVVNGESEYVLGMNLQQDVRDLVDLDCPAGTLECLRPNGSGWTFFPDAANEDGRGESAHCYMANMPAGDCTQSTGLNSNWTGGTESYAREPTLDWLAGFAD